MDDPGFDFEAISRANLDSFNISSEFLVGENSDGGGSQQCTHAQVTKVGRDKACTECGCVIEYLDYSFDSKGEDGNRCVYKTGISRMIDDVFSRNGVKVSEWLMDMGDQKYRRVVDTEKVRGKGRDALVAVCLLFCMREIGDKKTVDDIRRTFNVSKKDISTSLHRYYKYFPKDRTSYLNSEDLIKRTLDLQGVSVARYQAPIQRLCWLVKGKSKLINRSTPQSIATSLTFLYLSFRKECQEVIKDKKAFAKRAFISDITIDKILKEICLLFEIDKV